jgi:hypothetical protein
MQIDESDEQCANAATSIRESFEPVSNATLDSAPHQEKQLLPRNWTGEGMQIDESDEQWPNADSSIRESLEPVSNATLDNAPHE